MDLKNIIFVILLQIALVIAQKSEPNEAGKNVKLLSEKACKFCCLNSHQI